MTLESITEDTIKGKAIRELQGLGVALLAGAAAATNIALTGATVEGTTIVSVIHNTAGTLVDLTSEAAITTDGNLQLSTTDTTGDQLLVYYFNKP